MLADEDDFQESSVEIKWVEKKKRVGVNPQASPGNEAQYFALAVYLGTGTEPPSQGLVGGETNQTGRQSL